MQQTFCTFTLVLWWETSQWDSQRYLLLNRPSIHLSPIGSHLGHFAKPLICTEEDHAHHSNHLVSDFCLPSPAHHCNMHLSPRPQTILLKALLNTFGTCHKSHSMVTGYRNKDTEDVPDAQDSTPLHLAPQDHPMLEEETIHLMNIVKRPTLTTPWLTY